MNGAMKYIGEEEEATITLSGNSHVHVFANTGHANPPKVIVDKWTGSAKPTVTVTKTQVTIEGSDGDEAQLSVIDCG